MTDTLTVTLDDKQAQAAFTALIKRGSDTTELMRKAAGRLARVAEKAFLNERSPDGVPWVDLADLTKAARAKRGHWPGLKLQVIGTLAASVTTDYGNGWALIGSNEPYARIHQKGGRAGRGRKVDIPARPYLGVSPQALDAIREDMIAWVDTNQLASAHLEDAAGG